MKIDVIGGGAIGLLFAAYLSKSFAVTIFTKTSQQAAELNKHGIVLVKDQQSVSFRVQAKSMDEYEKPGDLAILAVKQYQLETVLAKLSEIPACDSLLFLQNGMGHLTFLENVSANNVYVGSVEHGAVKENSYTVRHHGEGITNVAVYNGSLSPLSRFMEKAPSGFPFIFQDNYYEMLLDKLIVNAMVNPLTAILQIENGLLIANSFYYQTLRIFFSEIAGIVKLKDPEASFEKVVHVCRQTAKNRSSMLKDIEAGRKTEVESILGFLLKEAEKQKKNAPLCTVFYHLIEGKERETEEGK
ncbi:2-dehydropantoate 2-reductase [Neobacillus sp. SM06]|uniref:2-dehydropantoate 2-reductase n=1 Tax=Neobacillus sp. SM06 TaxID=3422492 RepID=UPI003D297A73